MPMSNYYWNKTFVVHVVRGNVEKLQIVGTNKCEIWNYMGTNLKMNVKLLKARNGCCNCLSP